jgi:hypothetical protein
VNAHGVKEAKGPRKSTKEAFLKASNCDPVRENIAVHGFKGSEVQGYVLVPGLRSERVCM